MGGCTGDVGDDGDRGRAAFADLAEAEDLRLPESELLLEALSAGPTERRVRAARAMGRIQSAAYADGLAAAAGEGPPELRSEALFALGQLGLARSGGRHSTRPPSRLARPRAPGG